MHAYLQLLGQAWPYINLAVQDYAKTSLLPLLTETLCMDLNLETTIDLGEEVLAYRKQIEPSKIVRGGMDPVALNPHLVESIFILTRTLLYLDDAVGR